MHTSHAIIIVAGWAYSAACTLTPKITDLGIQNGRRVAWFLTALALALECIFSVI